MKITRILFVTLLVLTTVTTTTLALNTGNELVKKEIKENDLVKLGEFLETILKYLGFSVEQAKDDEHWAINYLRKAKELGIVSSDEFTENSLNNEITRGEVAKVINFIVAEFERNDSKEINISESNLTVEQKQVILISKQIGILNGYSNENFGYNEKVSKSLLNIIINRIAKKYIKPQLAVNDIQPKIKFKQLASTMYGDSAALTDDGRIIMWGSNSDGMFGTGHNKYIRFTPIAGNSTDWDQISIPLESSVLALKNDGTMWFWGTYSLTGYKTSPIQVAKNKKWRKLIEGTPYAIAQDGTLWNVFYNTVEQIGNDDDWLDIRDGNFNTYGIKEDGSVWSWTDGTGWAAYLSKNPTKVLDSIEYIDFTTNFDDMYYIKSDGTIWALKAQSEFINKKVGKQFVSLKHEQISSDTDWLKLVNGARYALKDDGSLWFRGEYNADFELETEHRYKFNKVSCDKEFQLLSHNSTECYSPLGLDKDGSLWTWGNAHQFRLVYSYDKPDIKSNLALYKNVGEITKGLDGDVLLQDSISVSNFAENILTTLKINKSGKSAIDYLIYKGIIDPLNYPSYDKPILRKEAAKIVWQLLESKYRKTLVKWQSYRGNVNDIYNITPQFQKEVMMCYLTGIIKLTEEKDFKPYGFISETNMNDIINQMKTIKSSNNLKVLKEIKPQELREPKKPYFQEKWLAFNPYVGKKLYDYFDVYMDSVYSIVELKEYDDSLKNNYFYSQPNYKEQYSTLNNYIKTKFNVAYNNLSEKKDYWYEDNTSNNRAKGKADYETRVLKYYSPIDKFSKLVDGKEVKIWAEDSLAYDIELLKKNQIIMQAEFIADEDLFVNDGYVKGVAGILRFIYYPPTNQQFLKDNNMIVGKWYEKRVIISGTSNKKSKRKADSYKEREDKWESYYYQYAWLKDIDYHGEIASLEYYNVAEPSILISYIK